MSKGSPKVAIYSGSFDPIHLGHVEFAIDALKKQKLDYIYFLPERLPRNKQVTHYAHRLAMIKLAIRPYQKLKVMELSDSQFSINKTLPKIKKQLSDSEIYFMFGSDIVKDISSWPNYLRLLNSAFVLISPRRSDSTASISLETINWPRQPIILPTNKQKDISSGKIRTSLMEGEVPKGLLKSSQKYIRDNWLYISLDITP